MKNVLLLFLISLAAGCATKSQIYDIRKVVDDREYSAEQLKEVYELSSMRQFYSLHTLLNKTALNNDCTTAKTYANKLLSIAELNKSDWNYGNAVLDAQMALGHCQFVAGNMTAAVAHLELASKTPGSPQLNSYGPGYANLQLIIDLLGAGKKQPALDFLEQSKRYWKGPRADEERHQWEEEISHGKIPKFASMK